MSDRGEEDSADGDRGHYERKDHSAESNELFESLTGEIGSPPNEKNKNINDKLEVAS